MHRSRLSQLIIDCRTDDLDRAASFWAQVLGYAADALPDPEDARYRKLRTPAGHPNILVQQVVHPSRVHLDLESDDVEAEMRRLEALGAQRVERIKTWWVMEAPTGQRFCVLREQRPGLAEDGHLWP